VVGDLGRARAALESGDAGAALDALLQAWRAVPHQAVGRLVCAVGRRARPVALAGQGARSRGADWDRRASERVAADLTLLLDELVLPSAQATALRLEALADWPSDPRFAEAAVRLFRSPPFSTFGQRVFWDTLERLVEKSPVPDLATQLEEIPHDLDVVRESARALVAVSRRWFASGAPTLRRAELEHCQAMTRLCAPTASRGATSEEAFLARIFADPSSDEARLVYADWLQERGDPRGELIALQCRRSKRTTAREEALLRLHAKTWLGPLGAVVRLSGLVFERGFPAVGHLAGPLSALRRVAGHPAWSTFRALEVGRVPSHEPAVVQMIVELSKRGIAMTGLDAHPHLAHEIARGKRPLLPSTWLTAGDLLEPPLDDDLDGF